MMIKMKILLVAVVLFVTIEAASHQGWNNYRSTRNGRRNGHGPPWAYSQQQDSINEYSYDLKWMIITTQNDNTQHPGRGPWWKWQNVPPGHQREYRQPGNYWSQPVIIVQQEPTTIDVNQPSLPTLPLVTKTPNILDNDNEPQSTPHYHGGEGQIDVRFGAE